EFGDEIVDVVDRWRGMHRLLPSCGWSLTGGTGRSTDTSWKRHDRRDQHTGAGRSTPHRVPSLLGGHGTGEVRGPCQPDPVTWSAWSHSDPQCNEFCVIRPPKGRLRPAARR